ncbi:MAG: hypothetical protein P4N41_03820 [Negativicutes bacterium]|nr:hypothetical protein [Negativicutes bacterium]
MNVSKVIDLASYKKASEARCDRSEMMELEDTLNILCEEAWHLLVPMRRLRIKELTLDSGGNILNLSYRDDDSDEPIRH